MKASDIEIGHTYLLITDSPTRKHLSGKSFTVVNRREVWRHLHFKGKAKVVRFFNDDNVGVPADELQEWDGEQQPRQHANNEPDLPF